MESDNMTPEDNKVDEFAVKPAENKVDEFERASKAEIPPAAQPPAAPPAPVYAKPRREHHSIFWPIILITLGVMFLLSNLGITSHFNFGSLVPYWPVLLILIGIDMLFSRISTFLSGLLGLAVAGGMIWLYLTGAGPDTGAEWQFSLPFTINDEAMEVKTETFTAALDDTDEAEIEIETSIGPVEIGPVSDDALLFDATITHYGELDFTDSGNSMRHISLFTRPTVNFRWPQSQPGDDLLWKIGINPEVPLDLDVAASVGDLALNLAGFALQRLVLDMSVGDAAIILPEGTYSVEYNASVGNGTFAIPRGSDSEYTLNMSTGSVTFDIADGANARIHVEDSSVGDLRVIADESLGIRLIVRDSGIGDIRVPRGMVKTEGEDDDSGTWETENYDSADYRVEIIVDSISTGDVIITFE